jgi:hypothetical protein
MRIFVLAMVAAAGITLVTSLEASAVPASGTSIALIGQQVDSVTNARTVRKRCYGAQRRDRYGYCIPNYLR